MTDLKSLNNEELLSFFTCGKPWSISANEALLYEEEILSRMNSHADLAEAKRLLGLYIDRDGCPAGCDSGSHGGCYRPVEPCEECWQTSSGWVAEDIKEENITNEVEFNNHPAVQARALLEKP